MPFRNLFIAVATPGFRINGGSGIGGNGIENATCLQHSVKSPGIGGGAGGVIDVPGGRTGRGTVWLGVHVI